MGWNLIASMDDLSSELGIEFPQGAEFDKFTEYIMATGMSDEYFQKHIEFPEQPGGYLGYLVPHTRFYFNASKCKQLRNDAVVALTVALTTQNVPVSVAVAAILKMIEGFSLLTELEAEVATQIVALSHGQPYELGVDAAIIIASWKDATASIDDILEIMEHKGVLRRTRDDTLRLVR